MFRSPHEQAERARAAQQRRALLEAAARGTGRQFYRSKTFAPIEDAKCVSLTAVVQCSHNGLNLYAGGLRAQVPWTRQ